MNYVTGVCKFLILFAFMAGGMAVNANAQTYFLDGTCVYEGDKYFYSQKAVLEKQNTFIGKI